MRKTTRRDELISSDGLGGEVCSLLHGPYRAMWTTFTHWEQISNWIFWGI